MHFFSLSILILIQINWRFVILSKKYFLAFLIPEECPFCHICPFMICTVINLHISNSFRMHTYAVGFIFSSCVWINVSNFFLYRLFVCCLFLHRLCRLCNLPYRKLLVPQSCLLPDLISALPEALPYIPLLPEDLL